VDATPDRFVIAEEKYPDFFLLRAR